jgi:hypothetical protein
MDVLTNYARVCEGPCGRKLHYRDAFERMLYDPRGLEGWCNECYYQQAAYCFTIKRDVPKKKQCDYCHKVGRTYHYQHNYNEPYSIEFLCKRCLVYYTEKEAEYVRRARLSGVTPEPGPRGA